MRVDALEVAQDVEMQRAGLDALGPAAAQAVQIAVGGFAFAVAEADLLLEELAGHADVATDEDGERQLDGVENLAVEGVDVARALFREAQPVLDLLGGELDQVLVDDVADMFEVGGEG